MTHFSEPEKSTKAGRENNGKMIRVADVLHTLFSHFSGPQNSPLHAVGAVAIGATIVESPPAAIILLLVFAHSVLKTSVN